MKTFSQFLMEEDKNDAYPIDYQIEFGVRSMSVIDFSRFDTSKVNTSRKQLNLEITKEFKKLFGSEFMVSDFISSVTSSFKFIFYIPVKSSNFNEDLVIDTIYNNLPQILGPRANQDSIIDFKFDGAVQCKEVPRFPLTATNFQFDADSLHNIHKMITCKHLLKVNAIDCHHSTLGILLTKGGFRLIDLQSDMTPGWFKIVKKHYESDKDVLECQEELIKAGLKEYAKL